MTTIHQYDDAGFYTGQSEEIEDTDGCPPSWTRSPLPTDLTSAQLARYMGGGDGWVVSFREPPPASAPSTVPHSVTRFQAKAALDEAGHLDAIEAIIANPDTPRLYVLAWQDALTFERDSRTLAALAGMLGLSDTDLDALFIRAAEIKS